MPEKEKQREFKDTVGVGFFWNFTLTVILFFAMMLFSIMSGGVDESFVWLILLCLGLPGTIILAGVISGSILTFRECPIAARVNWMLAIAVFAIMGGCMLMIGM